MRVDQLGLLLWKNYVIRKRQPGILALVFFWPIVVFLILFTVRDNQDPEYHPTCQFPARSMPQDGFLPFVRSFVCSVSNPCDPLTDYEEVPSYGKATLGPLVVDLQPMLGNATILSAVGTLPQSIQLLKSMAQILTRPEIKALFDRGIRLGDLFNNHEEIKDYLKQQIPDTKREFIDGLFNSSIKLLYLIETFGSSDVSGVVCSPDSLRKFLILEHEEDFTNVSSVLCAIDTEKVPAIFESLSKHLDFSGLLAMVDRAMAKFRDYDFFLDLRRAVETILDLKTVRKYIPEYLRVREWMPKTIMLFKNVTFKEIDLNFINRTIELLEPIFQSERDWARARQGLHRLNKMLALVKGMQPQKNNDSTSKNFPTFIAQLRKFSGNIEVFTRHSDNYENLTQVLDLTFSLLQDGAQLTTKLLDRHADEILLSAELLDALRGFFSENIMNSIGYIVSLMTSITQMTHHVTVIHEDTLHRFYQVSMKHRSLVEKLLNEVEPMMYKSLISSFSRVDFVEEFVDEIQDIKPADVVCKPETFNRIFEGVNAAQAAKVRELLCTESGERFLSELYDSFEFGNFEQIIRNTLSTTIKMALQQSVEVERSNLTTLVRSVKSFVAYLETPRLPDPDWSIFDVSQNWTETFKEQERHGRLDLLTIHLSIAKQLGSSNPSYIMIKPDLQNMDILAEIILADLRKNPTSWIEQVRLRQAQLIESFYLTVTDREKVLRILEYSNFTRIYCVDPRPPPLLNFPKDSNETLLRELICRLSRTVQTDLELNMTNIDVESNYYVKQRKFNWTTFNERTIEIYRYIDTLVHQEDGNVNSTYLQRLRDDFRTSWTMNLTVKDAWEVSVGLICKGFNVMESPLFDIQSRPDWRNIYAIAWASSVIFDNIETIVDQIQRNNHLAKLPEILKDMPQTEILIDVILRNLSPFVMDLVDIITMKPVHFISALDEYKSREKQWPCIQNESVGSVLELRDGSREIVREIERVSCNPGLFIREWLEQPTLMRVRKIFQHDDTVELPAFNWTSGYMKFRRLTRKFDDLLRNQIILQEEPKLPDYIKALSIQVQGIFSQRMPNFEGEAKNALDYIDLELDKTINAFGSNRSASGIWNPSTGIEDRVLISSKFLSHVIHKSTKIMTEILRNVVPNDSWSEPGKISLLSLLGFDRKTAVAIFYNQLPYILSTLVNGLSDPLLDKNLAGELEKNDRGIECEHLFELWADFAIGISQEEYWIIKNFTCDLNVENFNAYTDLYLAENLVWRRPVSSYRSYVMTAIGDIFDFIYLVRDVKEKGVVIEKPFSKRYMQHTIELLRNTLRSPGESAMMGEKSSEDYEWTNYRLLVEGISEALTHISTGLKRTQGKEGEIALPDLVESSDVRQLLRILELHPEETIALTASVANVHPTTEYFIPYTEIRSAMCSYHFNSTYWTTPERSRFLNKICSFDAYQLLSSMTGVDYYNTLIGRNTTSLKPTPLSSSLLELLDVVSNITIIEPNFTVYSNIFNHTTWRILSNETWSLIDQAVMAWVQVSTGKVRNSDVSIDTMKSSENTMFTKLVRFYQLLTSVTDLLSGGDVWQKLRVYYQSSKVKPLLNLVEDVPNLAISTVDTFVSTERLTDFIEKLLLGKVHPCDIDKYLIPPHFMRKQGLMSSITNFCQKVVFAENEITLIDVLPLDLKYEEGIAKNSGNESYLWEKREQLRTTLIRLISEGFKEPKVPTWWMSFKEGTFKDFQAQYRSKDPRAIAHSVLKKLTSSVKQVLKSMTDAKDCSWCFTLPLQIVNSQLSQHELYSKLLCQINRLNVSQLHDILMRDFYWNKTSSMMKNYRYLNTKKSLDEFVSTLELTLHYFVDIIANYQNDTYSQTVKECFYKFVGGPTYSRPGLYISFLLGIVDTLQRNVFIIDTASNHQKIGSLTKLAEEHVPIWKPLREVVKKSYIDEIDKFLPNASINVNSLLNDRNNSFCRTKGDCQNSTLLYNYLISKRAGKVFRYDAKALGYPSTKEISVKLSRSLDLELVSGELRSWRQAAAWDLTWLKEILQHLSMVVGEGSNLLDVASKIDFEDIQHALGVPDVVDGVVHILKDKTVDKLFDGIKEILEDVGPFIKNQDVMDDLNTIVSTLASMEIFKNLGLLDMKYAVRDMFDNWDEVRSFVVEKMDFSNEIASTLGQAKIDMVSVFMKERGAIGLKDTICSPEKLGDMLNLDNTGLSIVQVSSVLCQLNDSQTQNVTITLIKNMNFDYIFKNVMTANVKNILANANLSETQGKMVLDNLGVASELLPFFRDRLSNTMTSVQDEEEAVNETHEPISTSQFLQDSNEMLCGRKLVSDNSDLYRYVSRIEDNTKKYDERELQSLPSDFCRETYKGVLTMPGGKIVWSYVKPLLRGQILYTPNTTVVTQVMKLANRSFVQMESFSTLMESFEKTLNSLTDLSDMSDNLRELQDIMSSDVMKIAIKSFGGGDFDGGDFSDLNLSEIAWRLKRSKRLITMIGMLNDMMGCVLVDRMRGFSNEDDLEEEARRLMETREFLAGVVFLDEKTTRSTRSLDYELPSNVTYKIRMDIDYVPSTNRLKNQFWIPGPESSFIEDLRYLRGFIQLQDSIDRAIIRMKTGTDHNWKTVTQQMPYPCWKHVPFQTTLYESQGLQVCFFFALMMCVGAAVRHIVWERESRNSMVMSVMGLKPWRNTLAWFITSFAELLIVMCSISLIVLAGKILPKSDPLLIMILLIDYVFSIVTFCYMISTMFSSASLAAVTTVVMFLLTYMPYIIVIAMEAVIGLGYKLLICLSMSTSFCYGCLYAVRKEVQGVGLTWGSMWEESSPGDSMSLGLVLLAIAFDGCLYALIGYLITRYTNSGRGFHDLRSHSLWWAKGRSLYGKPRYLAFVNNLYFTNDVLHHSDIYQDDESDISRLTVSEKQVGVRFENVRKVYRSDRGDVVAVDDFSLKLCEGEVTSLLGRNGAGKTTIIKMLTGMLAPSSGEICLSGTEGCKPDIGVCPQDNVLIGTLTPREHMFFYSRLKRPKEGIDMQRSVNEMLASLELGRQEHEPVNRLSGGTKRRLCVALAFLGSPKLVILDEPGAGVDPAARRRIWRLIDQHRLGRTVLLSTHHLDEADMLSDTVVVMHKGKILCTGSPLSLKLNHGRGYKLNVVFASDSEVNSDSVDKKKLETLRKVIEEVVANASINEISGSEVDIILPFQGKHGLNNDIAQAAKALEDSRKLLGFSHFSLECDTLERVFLDLCSRADAGTPITQASQESIASVDHVGLSIPKDDIDLMESERPTNPSAVRQARALLKKRMWHFAKDWRSALAALLLPTMFVAVAMGFSLIRPPSQNEPPLDLTPKLYDTHPTYFYSIDNCNDPFLQHVSLELHESFGDDYAGAWQTMPNDTGTCECVDGQQTCRDVSKAVEGLLQVLPGRSTLDWVVSTHQEYIEKRYGGWSLSHAKEDPLFIVWFNNKGHHALPSYLNALNEAILRGLGVQGHLTTLNHPLKLSSDQLNRTTLLQHVADVGVALVLLIAFSMVAAQGTKELVRERLSEEKRILYLAGVHPITYWTSALIWDFLVFLCAITLGIIVFEIFGLPTYVERDNLAGTCLLLVLFAWASIPFSHLVEKMFDEPSLSNMVLFCVNTFIGVMSLATILVIDILGRTKAAEEARNILHNILMIFPQYALGDALVQLSRNDITAQLLKPFHMDTYQSPLGWDLLGLHYVFLAVVGAFLFLLNIMIECRVLPTWSPQRFAYEVVQEDDDVSRERIRAESGVKGDAIQTIRLRKEYRSVYGTNIAVQNLSIGVQSGKCFGLLGTNGAGKSTTFKMLTTEIIPTAGKIMLKGKEVGVGPLCNGEVGYCPQSDALDGFLSPHQCLTIHGEVCGLSDVARAVEMTLTRLDLLKYAHRRVDSLSGGNRRKLCTALSVMAPVSVVLMDEPTSGMDPATKGFVARAIRNVTKNQASVILTSHSVVECENLCNTVGILARAGLRCIGTPQHLKHKFGEGYVAFLRFSQPVSSLELRRAISKYIPRAVISSRQATAARLLLPRRQDVALSTSFSRMKLMAEELKATDYTLTQSSLDQVLVNFSEEMEDDLIDVSDGQASRNNHANAYPELDSIHMETF